MKDKHASLSKSFHTLHGESVVSLAKLGLSIEQRISNTLLANNCNLLALICQAPIAGDTAAVISKGVISLLRRQNGNATEKFLQRLLLAKIKQYQKKGRDLSDIIRDNSMAAMLLNAFARNEGLAYLNQSLGPPLQTVMGYVDQCEIDPQRLNAESDTDIHANEERLKQSCTTLLDHVSEKREGMPPSIRRICSFIKSNIEIALQAQETDRLSDHGRGLLNKTLNSFDDKTSSRNSSIRRSRSPSSPWQADDNRQRARGKSVSSSLNSPNPRPLGSSRCRSGSSTYSTSTFPLSRGNRSRSNTHRAQSESVGDLSASNLASSPSATDIPVFRLFGWRKAGGRASQCALESSNHEYLSNIDANDSPRTDIADLIATGSPPQSPPFSRRRRRGSETPRSDKKTGSSPNLSNVGLNTSPSVGSSFAAVMKRASQARGEGRFVPLSWPTYKPDSKKERGSPPPSSTASKSDSALIIAAMGTGHQPMAKFPEEGCRSETGSFVEKGMTPTSSMQGFGGEEEGASRKSSLRYVVSASEDAEEFIMDPIFSRSETHRSGAQDSERLLPQVGDEAEVSEGIMVNQTRFLHPSKSLSAVKLEEVSPHGLNTRATGCLGTPEKVVGSFLFLRFLIPAITSPDTYGLVDSRPSASARRGLILSGKVLTALCNDIEFSTKESYLMSMNDFLRDHRDVVKEYLSYAACDDHTPPPPTDPPRQEKKSFHLKDTLKNDLNPRRKALSASMPSLNISSLDLSKPDAPHTPKLTRHFRPGPPKLEPSRSSSTLRLGSSSSRIDITDLDELFTHIGHSIDVIEKEIEERVDGMGVGEAEGVVANFFEMKRLVEMSPYGRKGDGGEGGFGKAGVVLAKWSKSIKGIFVSKSRSQSTHDLTVS